MRTTLFALLLIALPAGAHAQRLDLVCLGGGSANKHATTTAYAHDNWGDSAWVTATANRAVPFDDQVNLWVDGEDGRIRLPRTMLPIVHGGDAGWFKLGDVKISRTEITGKAKVNFMNNPNVRIDRMSGTISIDGRAGQYSGHCQAYDPQTATPQF